MATLLCFGLFASDLFSSVEMNESQLYPLALLALYRVRTRYLLWIMCSLTVVLTVAGYLIEPSADVWDGVTNRVFSLLVIIVTVTGMSKMAVYEHKMFIDSVTDSLTGLLNRRYFNELSEKEATRSRRHGLRFAVLMLDIDHFKRVNDTFGHPVGDMVIKALAQICNKALRPHDILARYGGEEFILTLPHTDEEGASVVAERIRQAAQEIELATPTGPVRFTVSIGISINTKDLPFEQLVGRADEALYKAKEGGRNRVVSLPFENGMAPA
jgi:diguanylate cyclase (GGDEF)-like protein